MARFSEDISEISIASPRAISGTDVETRATAPEVVDVIIGNVNGFLQIRHRISTTIAVISLVIEAIGTTTSAFFWKIGSLPPRSTTSAAADATASWRVACHWSAAAAFPLPWRGSGGVLRWPASISGTGRLGSR